MSLPSGQLTSLIQSLREGRLDAGALAELGRELDYLHGASVRRRPAMEVISDQVEIPGTATSFVFNAIPQDYRHLHIIASLRSTLGATSEALSSRCNGDSGSVYDIERMTGQAAAASAGESLAQNRAVLALVPGSTAPASAFGFLDILIPDYANPNKNKVWVSRYGMHTGTATTNYLIDLRYSNYRTAAAMQRFDLILDGGGAFAAGSRATLYGLF